MTTQTEIPDHDYLTLWQQGVAGGNVLIIPDGKHVIRCTGFVYEDDHALPGATYIDAMGEADPIGRVMRAVNDPVWLTPAFAKALLDRLSSPDAFDRVTAGERVTTRANVYELEEGANGSTD